MWGTVASIGMSLLGFAEGGYVSGKGTGTSDSIPAMLSNGEFVINSKATRQYAPLLAMLNSGSFKGFAEGGLVGSMPRANASMSALDIKATDQRKSEQVFNIQVTGDISRQTKREIMSMLPELSAGVNKFNRETGY